jgi:hypothetical protein
VFLASNRPSFHLAFTEIFWKSRKKVENRKKLSEIAKHHDAYKKMSVLEGGKRGVVRPLHS